MMFFNLEIALLVVFLGLLFFFSLVESAIIQSSPLLLRMILEHGDESAPPLLPAILENRNQVFVPLQFGTQFCAITIVVLSTHLSLGLWPVYGWVYAFLANIVLSVLFRQLLPRLLTQHEPEEKLATLLRAFHPLSLILRPVALPLSQVLNLHKRMHDEVHSGGRDEDEEATGEEIQAYLEIGEDEGILEEEDSRLIQSVVEFGNTLVREVMTPRTKIVACEEGATVAQLRDIMVEHRHSRIPIYRGDLDHIVGVAYIRQLMTLSVTGRDSDPITDLIHPVLFVPGSKPVSKLLKELQERGDHTAIVIDEFGGVAGLVTIEDLVEEIVGEIWDEDEAKVNQVVKEDPGTFLVHGSAEIFRLEELAGKKFEDSGCSTVAGLLMGFLGRVPAPGEAFEMEGMRVQVIDADRKRVHWVRFHLPGVPGADGAGQ
ncbi:MAG: HlyC/CorC family transporter [Acidobacteria bacterium]|nr:HlyC/CorC family transporter [Acidobacteriota bacterium]